MTDSEIIQCCQKITYLAGLHKAYPLMEAMTYFERLRESMDYDLKWLHYLDSFPQYNTLEAINKNTGEQIFYAIF